MSEKIPRFIPLPEVSSHTDDVIFGGLGLPVGFDESKLLVNLGAVNRVRTIGGLGTVSTIASEHRIERIMPQADGVNKDGAVTGRLFAARRPEEPLSNVKVTYPSGSSFFYKPTVVIDVNRSEIDERIFESDDRQKNVRDAGVQAKYLNQAVKTGLLEACTKANIDNVKLLTAAKYYGVWGTLSAISANPKEFIAIAAGMAPLLYNVGMTQLILIEWLKQENEFDLGVAWKSMRQSLIFGAAAVDRVALSAISLKSSRIIKAAKGD